MGDQSGIKSDSCLGFGFWDLKFVWELGIGAGSLSQSGEFAFDQAAACRAVSMGASFPHGCLRGAVCMRLRRRLMA